MSVQEIASVSIDNDVNQLLGDFHSYCLTDFPFRRADSDWYSVLRNACSLRMPEYCALRISSA